MIETWPKSAKSSIRQGFADKERMILMKGWFSNFEVLEICWRDRNEEFTTKKKKKKKEEKKKGAPDTKWNTKY